MVHFGLFWSTSSIRSSLIYFSPLRSIWVQFGLLWSTWVQLGPFGLLKSSLVQFGLYDPIGPFVLLRTNLAYSVNSIHFDLYGPIWSIRSTYAYSIQFGPFGPRQITSVQFWCTYLRMEKYKFGLRVILLICVISITITSV